MRSWTVHLLWRQIQLARSCHLVAVPWLQAQLGRLEAGSQAGTQAHPGRSGRLVAVPWLQAQPGGHLEARPGSGTSGRLMLPIGNLEALHGSHPVMRSLQFQRSLRLLLCSKRQSLSGRTPPLLLPHKALFFRQSLRSLSTRRTGNEHKRHMRRAKLMHDMRSPHGLPRGTRQGAWGPLQKDRLSRNCPEA